MHIYAFYNDFTAPPRYGAMLQALYSLLAKRLERSLNG